MILLLFSLLDTSTFNRVINYSTSGNNERKKNEKKKINDSWNTDYFGNSVRFFDYEILVIWLKVKDRFWFFCCPRGRVSPCRLNLPFVKW